MKYVALECASDSGRRMEFASVIGAIYCGVSEGLGSSGVRVMSPKN
jgi:hypothetical protein